MPDLFVMTDMWIVEEPHTAYTKYLVPAETLSRAIEQLHWFHRLTCAGWPYPNLVVDDELFYTTGKLHGGH